tara:strand:- start:638 stop:1123 length:486 start_codon:yes stop_codon:yes gene_type:complete
MMNQSQSSSIQISGKSNGESEKSILEKELRNIERRIAELNRGLIEVQLVKLRAKFSQDKNLITLVQKRVFSGAIDESLNWHMKNIWQAYKEKNRIQARYDLITKTIWTRYLQKLIRISFYLALLAVVILVTLMSISLILSMLPLIVIGIIIYLFAIQTKAN